MKLVTQHVDTLEEAVAKAERDLDPSKLRKVFTAFPKLVCVCACVCVCVHACACAWLLSCLRAKARQPRQIPLHIGDLPNLSKPASTLVHPFQNSVCV